MREKEIIFELQKIALADDLMANRVGAAIEYRNIVRGILEKMLNTPHLPPSMGKEEIFKSIDECILSYKTGGQKKLKDLLSATSLSEERTREAMFIVKELALWSKKYPRGRIYGGSNKEMDDELIQIEETAKKFIFVQQ